MIQTYTRRPTGQEIERRVHHDVNAQVTTSWWGLGQGMVRPDGVCSERGPFPGYWPSRHAALEEVI